VQHEASGTGEPSGSAPSDVQAARRAIRRRLIQAVALLVLVVILVAFVIENSTRVKISFVFFTREVRPIWLMLTCAALGALVGFLLGRPGRQLRGREDGDAKERGRRRDANG